MKIDIRNQGRTTRPVTLTLKLATIKRLEFEVAKGSWSGFIDRAINLHLDELIGIKS